jgi:two-component system cell cycle sensor histidine kinase/response regulator CckA
MLFLSFHKMIDRRRPASRIRRSLTTGSGFLISTGSWCVIAILISAAALLIADLLPVDEPMILFVPPIAVVAYLGGAVPGWVATATLAAGTVRFLVIPKMSFDTSAPIECTEVVALVVTGVVISVLCETVRRARRAAEASLLRAKQSEQRFSESFHVSPIALLVTNLVTNRIAEVNPACLGLTGWSRAEMVGRTVVELGAFPAILYDQLLSRLAEDGEIRNYPAVVYGKDGEPRDISLAMDLLEIDGELHSLTTVFDESARKRTEAALRSSDEKLRELAENIGEVFWLSSPDCARLLYISPAYEKVWGRSCASAYADPTTWTDAIHCHDRAALLEIGKLHSHDPHETEFRIVRPDNTTRWIRSKAVPIHDAAGQIVRIAGVAVDVTERRALEEQLRQTQKMESLGLLAGGVAHDFNNMLAVITFCNDLLAESIPSDSPDHELVEEVEHAVTRAAGLTRQLLAFSRKQVAEPVVLDLNALVKETRNMLRRLVGEDIALTLSLDPELAQVRIDPGCFVQVVMNLAVNARDAMPRGGTLAIGTRMVAGLSLDVSTSVRWVEVLVRDSGTGMSDEVRARVFEPFFTTKEPGKGTGMGLAVVHGIVDQAAGKLEVESVIGLGTTFRVLLPAVDAPATRPRESIEPASRGVETILLVEDDELVRRTAARALRSNGYTVLEASGGESALRMLVGGNRVDLLLTDVVMPGMDGRELAEVSRRALPALRVLYMSGYDDDVIVRRGAERGQIDLIEKPFRIPILAARVRLALDAKQATQPMPLAERLRPPVPG